MASLTISDNILKKFFGILSHNMLGIIILPEYPAFFYNLKDFQ
jgi:hypothetical protein